MCIDIVQIWYGIANGQILTGLPKTRPNFRFWMITSKCPGILTKLGTCIDIKEIWFGIANGQTTPVFDRVNFFYFIVFLN